MASFHSGRQGRAMQRNSVAARAEGNADELLAPMLAGAYARGIAETFDMLDLPGLLIDGEGEVLFASRATTPLLNGPLRLRMHHLVAEHAEDNRVLAAFIADAVGKGASGSVCLPHAGLEVHRLPQMSVTAMRGQRVRAGLVLTDGRNPHHAALLQWLAGVVLMDR